MNKLKLFTVSFVLAGGLSAQTTCQGLTQDSVQCKNTTKDTSSLCYLHNPNYVPAGESYKISPAVKCSGITQKNKPCKNKTKDGSGFCHRHRN